MDTTLTSFIWVWITLILVVNLFGIVGLFIGLVCSSVQTAPGRRYKRSRRFTARSASWTGFWNC